MAHPYGGTDPFTPNAPIPGKGIWVTPTLVDDSEDRDAAGYSVGQEGLADRTNWLAWRMVNGLESNTALTPYPANIWWSGAHVFQGNVTVNAGNVVTIGSPTTFNATATFNGSSPANIGIVCNGSATFNDPVTFTDTVTLNDPVTITDRTTRSGADAYEVGRQGTGSASTTTINPWEQDTWICPTLAADINWTLSAPPSNRIVRTTIWLQQPNTFRLDLLNPGGGGSVGLYLGNTAQAVGYYRAFTLEWNGSSAWMIVGSHFVKV